MLQIAENHVCDDDKNLREILEDLLTPSTTATELDNNNVRDGTRYCPYLRLKQNTMDRHKWLVGGHVHNGTHFPIGCVYK